MNRQELINDMSLKEIWDYLEENYPDRAMNDFWQPDGFAELMRVAKKEVEEVNNEKRTITVITKKVNNE